MATWWDQTCGTLTDGVSTNMKGKAVCVTSGNSYIGGTLESFTMEMKTSNTSTNIPLKFGVWSAGNNTTTPSTAFTGSLSNNNGLTTSMVTYTFTGSHTLATDDRIGVAYDTPNVILYWMQANNDCSCSADYTLQTYLSVSGGAWINTVDCYSPNMTTTGSGGPSPGGSTTSFPPPPFNLVSL